MLFMFEDELRKIDKKIDVTDTSLLPHLLERLPLDVFGKLLLDVPGQYRNIKAFFPTMPEDKVQDNWTGNHGEALLTQSLSFIKTMLTGYSVITGESIGQSRVLDYGCGWGRLMRLLYKYVPIDQIYGVDPWDESIKHCESQGVKGHLAVSDYVPEKLPFDEKFDLIFAFSVFSHLSEKTAHVVLSTLRKYINPKGLLVITIRPKEYWNVAPGGVDSNKMSKLHDSKGYAFIPFGGAMIDGDITYGDASISLDYMESNFPQWRITHVEWNETDPYQVVLFLKPAAD